MYACVLEGAARIPVRAFQTNENVWTNYQQAPYVTNLAQEAIRRTHTVFLDAQDLPRLAGAKRTVRRSDGSCRRSGVRVTSSVPPSTSAMSASSGLACARTCLRAKAHGGHIINCR